VRVREVACPKSRLHSLRARAPPLAQRGGRRAVGAGRVAGMDHSWMPDELRHAGAEHLAPEFVAGFDRKQG